MTMEADHAALAPKVSVLEMSDTYGQIVIEPLESGFGMTLGNALRRVLLSSIPGAAVTRVRFSGKYHEYDTMPGVRETILEIILNLKGLSIRLTQGDESRRLILHADKEGEVTAASIEAHSGVQVLDTSHYIATIDKGGSLEAELEVETGYGYRAAERNKKEDMPLGVIAIDSDFAPVKLVNYQVEETRVGERTDFERLVITLETNGGVQPEEAIHHASQILISHFQLFADLSQHPFAIAQEEEDEIKQMESTLEALDFDKRAINLLGERNITTLGELLSHSREELLDIHKFGDKSLTKVDERLLELGYELKLMRKKD
jgi:DNA-directed RNA polymerase subunit alpha